ncbi:Transcriptional activator CadC [Serratia fonticola]|uniref:Transcriptional activator CadC n=1 Tax=Serratia fonticola TaxID=47917 RepID=A0A4U9USH2_SERFO|nr:winged helix-turn-helix domain-containing protein [Serratia fonticola]CAI1684410.1 Transcriptional activator CadC [Serratia fonticola]VTR36676.1 Transcriptional activator CadC [Serratia fonticola]
MLTYEFGDYVLTDDGQLSYKNESVEIPPKELALLYVLLNANGALLSKDEIIEKVWYGASISDESLTRCIYGLRRILGINKHYIRTFYGRGYRFSPPQIKKKEIDKRMTTSLDVSNLFYSNTFAPGNLTYSVTAPSTMILSTKKISNLGRN